MLTVGKNVNDVSGAEKQGFFKTSRAITQKNIELWREKVVKRG